MNFIKALFRRKARMPAQSPSAASQPDESSSTHPSASQEIQVHAFSTAEEYLASSRGLKDKEEAATRDKQGAELFFHGNLLEGEKFFMRAIQLNPNLATAYGNLGHVFQKRGMYANAVGWLEKALSLDPHLEGVPDALDICRKAAQEKVTPPAQETIIRLRKAGIEFTRKYTETTTGHGGLGPVEFTYEKYESSSMERAIEFLNQRGPVTQSYYYVEVKTPKGCVGRDIDGIYKESEQ